MGNSMVKQRQEHLWQLARMYKVMREAYEEVRKAGACWSWMLADNMEISQSAASDLLRALHEVGLLERCEKDENGGFGYVVSGG